MNCLGFSNFNLQCSGVLALTCVVLCIAVGHDINILLGGGRDKRIWG